MVNDVTQEYYVVDSLQTNLYILILPEKGFDVLPFKLRVYVPSFGVLSGLLQEGSPEFMSKPGNQNYHQQKPPVAGILRSGFRFADTTTAATTTV